MLGLFFPFYWKETAIQGSDMYSSKVTHSSMLDLGIHSKSDNRVSAFIYLFLNSTTGPFKVS